MEFRERFKGRSLPKNQIGSPVRAHSARSCVNVRRSTRHGHVFSAGAPNSRRPFPSLSLSLSSRRCSQRPPPRQSDPGGSFQDTVGYPQRIRPFIRTLLYSLHNIVPPRSSPSAPPLETLRAPHRAGRGRNTRVAIRLGTVYPTPTSLWREADGQRRQRKREREREREGNRRAGPRRKPRDFLV